MDIEEERQDGILILGLTGRIDSQTSQKLEETVGAKLETERSLLFDFAEVPYISSAGLRVVLLAAKRLHGGRGQVGLCSLKPEILEIFEISGFTKILDIFEGRQDALTTMGRNPEAGTDSSSG